MAILHTLEISRMQFDKLLCCHLVDKYVLYREREREPLSFTTITPLRGFDRYDYYIAKGNVFLYDCDASLCCLKQLFNLISNYKKKNRKWNKRIDKLLFV